MSEGTNTDVAALTAGVVAVAVTMFVAPGPYDITGVAISTTLLTILYGYVLKGGSRTPPQSLALAAVSSLLILPIFGYCAELIAAWLGIEQGINGVGDKQSAVTSEVVTAFWFVGVVLFFYWDVRRPEILLCTGRFIDKILGAAAKEKSRTP